MRTTLDIDKKLLEDAMKAINAKTKTQAVEEGLRLLIKRHAHMRLADLFGAFPDAEAPRRRRPPTWS
jgi:Arc/MetJ family transcription regulator